MQELNLLQSRMTNRYPSHPYFLPLLPAIPFITDRPLPSLPLSLVTVRSQILLFCKNIDR